MQSLCSLASGQRIDNIVEQIDLFPTLVDLVGLPSVSKCPSSMVTSQVDLCVEGKSLAPMIQGDSSIDAGNFSALVQTARYPDHTDHIMGYSLVTDNYRYMAC